MDFSKLKDVQILLRKKTDDLGFRLSKTVKQTHLKTVFLGENTAVYGTEVHIRDCQVDGVQGSVAGEQGLMGLRVLQT